MFVRYPHTALKTDEKTIVDLRKDMQQIQERVQTSSNYVQMIPNRSSSDEQARNIEQLQSMSCDDVSVIYSAHIWPHCQPSPGWLAGSAILFYTY